ncbi:MAG: hypothetical protein R6W06_15120 [Prochlorococcaceae cyanobacterium]
MRTPPPSSNRQFNNADSFAMAFDEAWQVHSRHHGEASMDRTSKLEQVFSLVSEHPFFQDQPAMARQVADFRLRLLGL